MEIPIDVRPPKLVERDFQQVNVQLGRDQGNWILLGKKLGFTGLIHRSANEKRTRSACTKEWGTGSSSFHLLRSSAIKLSWPGMWPTSISIPVRAERRHNFSMKKQSGRDMVIILLLVDSAPELSERDFRQTGNLWLGKNLDVTQRSAI